jgi:hypothetical protein
MTLLMALSALLILVFLGALAYALVKIIFVLEAIGGTPTSYLAKLRLGLRAIERETSHLPIAVGKINEGLKTIAGGLVAVDGHLAGTIEALKKQEV